jgi:DNA-binding HxlR family transcriptional regulator
MSGYGQFCPVAKASEVLAERWTPLVIRELLCGSHRFNELQRGVPLMSRSLLAKRLRDLELAGVIERRPSGDGRGSEYHLTEAGEELRPIIMGIGAWGQRWARSDLSRADLDPRLLMWDMQRNIDTDALPPHRVVVRFRFTDASPGLPRVTWLILDGDQVDVCYKDPGFEVDLVVAGRLRALIAVWMGDTSMSAVMRAGELQIEGTRRLADAFPTWLRRSIFAGVERPRITRTPA